MPIDSVAPGYSTDSMDSMNGLNGFDIQPGSSGAGGGAGGIDLQPTPPNLPSDAPGPVEDTRFDPSAPAILSLQLPPEAKVYINDRLTKTEGSERRYVSKNLKQGKEYRYRVKAVIEKDGEMIVRNRLIKMRPGSEKTVAINFQPVLTTLVLNVPEDAKVILDGNETGMTGSRRTFATKKLHDGSWDDYTVEVVVERDGKQVVKRRSLDLAAGETRFLDFEFESGTTGLAAK